MADDVNSNNKPINGKAVDPRVDEILRAERRREEASKRAALEKQESRIKLSGILDPDDVEAQRVAIESASQALDVDVNKIESTARNQKTKQILTLGRQSRIEREITHMAQGSEAYMTGSSRQVQMMSSTQRQYQVSGLREKIESGYSDLAGMAARGASHEEILAASGPLSQYKKQAAALERGGKEASLKGLSEDRLIKRAEKIEEQHRESQSNQKIREEARAGGKGDLSKVTQDYDKSIETMTSANVKLKNLLQEEIDAKESSLLSEKERATELNRIGELVSRAKEKLDKASRDVETAGIVKKEVENAPSWFDQKFGPKGKFGPAIQFAKVGLEVAGNAAAGAKELMYSSEMRKGSAKANVIDATNQLYFKSKQAVMQGDVGAALDVMDSVTAARYADEKARGTAIPNFVSGGTSMLGGALGGGMAAGVGSAAAITGMALMGTGIGAPLGAAIIGGSMVLGAVAGGASSSGGFTDSVNGTAGINDRLQAYNTMKSLSSAERAIRTDQMQAYYSHGNMLYRTVQGMGGGGAGLQSQLMDPGVLKSLATSGVSADMAAGLASNFQAAGAFKGEDAVNVIKMAGTAGQKGVLNREQYTGMAAQLMGAGGGAGDLQQTLEFAVAKGMDNSKSISEMVQATMNMSSNLADMGVAATGATSQALMSTVAGLDAVGVDKNLAVRAAQASMYTVNQQMQDRSMTLGNVVETDIIRKAAGGSVNAYGAERIAKMGTSEWAMLNAVRSANSPADRKKAADAFRVYTDRYGITSSVFKGDTDEINEDKVKEYERGSLQILLNKSDVNEKGQHAGQSVMQKIMDAQSGPNKRKLTIKDFSEKERQIFGDELPALIARTQEMSPEEQKAFKKKYQEKADLAGAGGEKTAADASAEIIRLGKEFADTLNESAKPAFEKIEALMTVLNEDFIKNGAQRAKQSGDTGKIVADLSSGAKQFQSIMKETAETVNKLGMKVEVIPGSEKQDMADKQVQTFTRR